MAMAVSRSEAGTGEKVMLRGSDMVSERSRWEKQEQREEQGESDARRRVDDVRSRDVGEVDPQVGVCTVQRVWQTELTTVKNILKRIILD